MRGGKGFDNLEMITLETGKREGFFGEASRVSCFSVLKHVNEIDLRRTLASRRLGSCGLVSVFWVAGLSSQCWNQNGRVRLWCPKLAWSIFFVAASLEQFLGYAWTGDFLYFRFEMLSNKAYSHACPYFSICQALRSYISLCGIFAII